MDGFEWEMGWTWSDFGFRKIPLEGLDGVGTSIALGRLCAEWQSRPSKIRGGAQPAQVLSRKRALSRVSVH